MCPMEVNIIIGILCGFWLAFIVAAYIIRNNLKSTPEQRFFILNASCISYSLSSFFCSLAKKKHKDKISYWNLGYLVGWMLCITLDLILSYEPPTTQPYLDKEKNKGND